LSVKAQAYAEAFNRAIEEDLSTPRALAELWGLLRDGELAPEEALGVAFDMDTVLGLRLRDLLLAPKAEQQLDGELVKEIEALIAERSAAKKAKNYQRADEIRNMLKERGILLEDSPQGTTWRLGN
jgi:cysteinyl-tRNA synthetase